jgi:hypothetical protein
MSKRKDDSLPPLSPLELHRIAPMSEASRLSGLSEDTLTRHHSDKIKHLSPRRKGMRVGDALAVRAAEEPPNAA